MIDFSKPIDGTARLSEFFTWAMPELDEIKSEKTIADYQSFFRHWQRITGDPPMQDVTRDDLLVFRTRLLEESWIDDDGKQRKPLSPRTVAKHHGTFRNFFSKAVQLGLVKDIPQLYLFRKSVLSPEQARIRAKKARDIIGLEEMVRIFHGCAAARYPLSDVRKRRIDGGLRLLLWRVKIFLAWLYGQRISDLQSLSWECFDFHPRQNAPLGMVLFAPWKLRRKDRLQGLPLTELVRTVLAVLEAAMAHHSATLFPGATGPLFPFRWKSGSWNTPRDGARAYWIEGWRCTLQRDICASQGIIPTIGPDWFVRAVADRADCVPPITMHVFRQTAITQYNDYRSDTGRRLGRFIAGQTGGAVDEQSYDKPTKAIWEAICDREANLLPPIWRTWFASQPTS